MNPIQLFGVMTVLAASLVSACGDNAASGPNEPATAQQDKPQTTLDTFDPNSKPIVTLGDDEFKAALAVWLPTIGPCELALRANGHSAHLAPAEPVGPVSFPYGSISKSFTAVVVLKLVERGKLGLDDKLSKFQLSIPGDESITIQELLTHTSGLPDYFHGVDPALPPKPGQILSMIRNESTTSKLERGKFHYSNTNYFLLSEICAQVGRAPFSELLERYVCKPLGLASHTERLPSFDLNWYGGAGDIAGSIQELATFGEAMASQDKRLLSPESWKLLTSSHAHMPESHSDYGFGIIVAPMSIYPALSHAGEIPANAGVSPFVSMLIVRPGKFDPISFVVFGRVEWTPQSLNSLYGAFASTCATLDLKRWIATFCQGPSAAHIAEYVSAGAINPDLGRLISPEALGALRDRIGTLKTFIAKRELVRPGSVQLEGIATGSAGSASITAQFGPGGRLDGFGMK